MVIQTYAASTVKASPPTKPGNRSNPISWAFLLPGALGLGGLAFGARRRRWLNRFLLVALVGLVTLLGTTACNPRYYYLNHGPPANPATPAGTYNVLVTGQASNGVTALTQSSTIVLVVN
jgi:MYXO-CTERM domain-containing protein